MIQTIEELHRARQWILAHPVGTWFPWTDVSTSLLNQMFRQSYTDDINATRVWPILPPVREWTNEDGYINAEIERFEMPVGVIRDILRDRIHGAIVQEQFTSVPEGIMVDGILFTEQDLELLLMFNVVPSRVSTEARFRQTVMGNWIDENVSEETESRSMEEIEHEARGPVLEKHPPEIPKVTLSEAQVFYLKQLCGINGINYEALDKNLYVGVMDRKEINKIFFNTKPKYESVVIAPSHRKVLKEILGHFNDSKRVQDRLTQAQNRYRDYTQLMQQEYSTIVSCMRQLEAMKVFDGTSLIPSVEKLLSEGKVEIKQMSTVDKYIEFKMLQDVILREVNIQHGVDRTLNMGRYLLRLDLKNYRMNVYQHSGNIEVDGYFHPHVHREGVICWGNAKEAMERAFLETNVYDLINITLILLSEYNPVSPFKALYLFEREQKYENMGRYWVKESVLFAQTGLTTRSQVQYINSCIVDGDRFLEVSIYEERAGDKTFVLNSSDEMLDIKETPIVSDHPVDKEASDEMDDFEVEEEDTNEQQELIANAEESAEGYF